MTNKVCDECRIGTELFTKYTECKKVEEISGCKVYLTVNTCEICEDGYNRVSETSCLPIENAPACKY